MRARKYEDGTMKMTIACALLALAAAYPGSAGAADRREPPAIFRTLTGCRAVTDPAARLACYDSAAANLDTAEKAGDLVVADKTQIRESKKALFGFGAIRLPIFGGNDEAGPSEIEAKITSLRDLGYGKWEFGLDNGSRWRQTEAVDIFPKVGQTVVIKAAALGSYILRAGKQRAVRAIRTQ